MPISKTEEALVFAAKNGNTKCFEELYKIYYDKIYALAMTMVKNSADAEDVLQITFVKAWQKIDKLENVSAFNTWIQRITINQCNSILRGKKQSFSIDDESEDGEILQIESDLLLPEQYAEQDDLSIRLKEIVDDLSVVQRETILLYYYNELSVEEIAETMDCSVGTVKSRLFLARKAIKTEIEEKEKKSGEKFYGVAIIPFASLFIKQVKSFVISGEKASEIFSGISNTLFNTPLRKVSINPKHSEPSNGTKIFNSTSPNDHLSSPDSSLNASNMAKSGVASSTIKKSFPLWAKIVSIIIAIGVFTGGGIFVWNILKPAPVNPIINATVGSEFTYGKYEQDNNLGNGAEDIEWRVLDRQNDKLFVISKYALDCIEYNKDKNPNSWKDTDLRNWSNSTFYKKAFTKDEQKNISKTYIYSDEGSTLGLEDSVVTDKVFILNNYEQDIYFSSNDDRIAIATDYAIANGVKANKKKQTIWWLRSRCFENYIGAVYEDGYADGEKGGKYSDNFAFRPAMWIDTKAIADNEKAKDVVQPVTTKYLTESLRTFLCTFALHYDDKTYDNNKITEDSNILLGVIGDRECVDYSVYSKELAEQNSTDNWIITEEQQSPIKAINEKASMYKMLDSDKVDYILKNIFNCTNDDISKMRSWQSDYSPYGFADGKYYCSTGGNGSLGNNFEYKSCEYKNGEYYFTVEYYPDGYDNPYVETTTKTIYVKTKLLPHEGKPWWSLYYYSQDPFKIKKETEKVTVAEKETSQNEYVMGDRLVEYNNVVYYADNKGLWKKESDSDSKLLNKCSAIHLATNGQVIYYGAFNKSVEYSPYANSQIEVRQYDMYKYDIKTGENKKITSFIGDGEPICAIGDVIYYTDYSDDFDGNRAGLAKGIRSYNTTTRKKEYICDGAHLVQSYNGKIFYRTIMAAGGGYGVHQIHLFDTETGKSEIISEDNVMSFEVISGKLYYLIDNHFDTDNYTTKVCCYDISSGQTQVLLEKSDKTGKLQAYDDKYAIYSLGSQKFYRINLITGTEEQIKLSDLSEETTYSVFRCNDKTVFFTGNSIMHIYTIKDDSTKSNGGNDRISCSSIIEVKNNTVFYDKSEGDNYYLFTIGYIDINHSKSGWLGTWTADNGESLKIKKVTNKGISLVFSKRSEQGNMMSVDYKMEFDNSKKSIVSEIGDATDHGGWEYSFVLGDGYITVKSRYPDQIFYKK